MRRTAVLSWATAAIAAAVLGSAGPALAQGLEVAVEVNPDPVRPSQTLQVEYTVTNSGSTALTGVTLDSVLPTGIDFFSQNRSTGGGTCTGSGNLNTSCSAGETLSWALGTLTAGERVTVGLPPVVSSGTADGSTLTFEAEASDGTPVSASQTVTVDASPVFELAVDENPDPVAPGATLTYVLTFSNVSAATTPGTMLALPLPAGTTFVSASDSGVSFSGSVLWSLGSLTAGEGGTRTAVVTADGALDEGALLRTEAAISDSDDTTTAASVAAVRTASPFGALELAVAVTPDPVSPGEALDVEFTVSNPAAFPVSDVVLETWVPNLIASFSQNLTTGGGICTISGNLNTSCDRSERVQWSLGTLGSGERISVSLPPSVLGSTDGGRLVPWRANVVDSSGLARFSAQTVIVDDTPLFELVVDEQPDPVGPAETVHYTLSFSNVGSATATGSTLRLPLPPGTSFVSASDGGALSGDTVEWALGPVIPGQGETREAVLATDFGLLDGTLLRTMAQVADDAFPAASARAAALTAIQDDPQLRLGIAVTPDPVRPSETLAVELTATNAGSIPLVDVVLETRVPEGIGNFSQFSNSGGGVCTLSGNLNTTCSSRERIVWNLGTLAAGERVTVSLPPVVGGSIPDGRLIGWRATLEEGGGEQLVASQTAIVEDAATFALAISDAPDPAAASGTLNYTLAYANRDSATATGTTLRLPVPAGAAFVSASDGGALVGDEVVWVLGPLPPGRGGSRSAELLLDAGLVDGELLHTVATVEDDDFPRNLGRAAAVTAIDSDSPLELALEVNPDPVRPGESVLVELSVANSDAFAIFDVVVETRVPELVGAFNQSFASGGADCTVSGNLNTTCSVGERIRWELGALAAGARRTVTVPAEVLTAADPGELVRWRATASNGGGDQAVADHAVSVEDAPPLELTVDEGPDPVTPQDDLTIVLTFGNKGPGTSTGTTLALPEPTGTSFVSASEGGALMDGQVEWSLGPVPPGGTGTREATFEVLDPADRVLLHGAAGLRDDAGPPEEARANFVAAAEEGVPLALTLDVTPDPAQPNDVLQVDVTVRNQSAVPLFDVVAQVLLPDDLNSFSQGATTGGGLCSVSGNLNTSCTERERVVWNLGNLAAFQQVTVSLPPVVTGGTPDGTLVRFGAIVDGSQAVAHRTVRIGVDDFDADGVLDDEDNCVEIANGPDGGPNDQLDRDEDGFGNVCDCDFNQDQSCDIADFNAFLPDFVSQADSGLGTDMNGDGSVGLGDFNLFLPGFVTGVPGPSGLVP
ncbi:MAG: DUF11 domain-containing protein [Deltaproteobacteria bacterium]|nr:DUF11 domain-containing protein [Deltaproteobacteria bacterium]